MSTVQCTATLHGMHLRRHAEDIYRLDAQRNYYTGKMVSDIRDISRHAKRNCNGGFNNVAEFYYNLRSAAAYRLMSHVPPGAETRWKICST